MDIEDAQDGDVIISRKIMPGRSQIKVNGMICTVSQVKSIASLLIDIHGQHDSQLLLKESSHLDMIDLYGGSTVSDVRKRYDVVYKQYREALSQLEQMDTDEESRQREISFIEFELHEIASADLKRGEDEELESGFRKMSNSQRIISDLSTAVQLLSEGSDNVMDMMGIAVKSVIEASSFDESLKSVADSCSCAEDMISDVCRQISDYVNDSSYDEEEYKEVEERLDMIYSLKRKYGNSVKEILEYKDNIEKEINYINNSEEINKQLKNQINKLTKEMEEYSTKINQIRQKVAQELSEKINKELKDLEMPNARFKVNINKTQTFNKRGMDEVEFYISTNIGEDAKELAKIASGGEMSRIMLAIKTVLANTDSTPVLIFDEIDTGISGKAAKAVGQKLKLIGNKHQVICITHQPSIAAKGDENYFISKVTENDRTHTVIKKLTENEIIDEIARISNGDVTDIARKHAIELRKSA